MAKTAVFGQTAPSLSQFADIRPVHALSWDNIAFEPKPVVIETPVIVYPWPPVSRFAVLESLRTQLETRFLKPQVTAQPAEKPTPLKLKMNAAGKTVLSLKTAAAPAPLKMKSRVELPMPSEAEKPRSTLKLKMQMALPSSGRRISNHSSASEFAAAFKAEMQALENSVDITGQAKEVAAVQKTPPAAKKSWKELLAEAETRAAEPRGLNFDLAAAFKAEMQALTAQQAAEPRLATAFTPKTPAPRRAEPHRARILAA